MLFRNDGRRKDEFDKNVCVFSCFILLYSMLTAEVKLVSYDIFMQVNR